MKKFAQFLFVLIVLTISTIAIAQVPNGMNYQAVARDVSGNPLKMQSIALRISILSGSASGTAVYTERQSLQTNNLGLFTTVIGKGTALLGTFESIDWSKSSYFLQVGIDITGGTNYVSAGAEQLLAVPYAMYAKSSGTAGAKGDKGDTGAKGDKGEQGDAGIQGAKGEKGDTGIKGDKGEKGDQGSAGVQGVTGTTGAKGDKGDTGAKGDQGIAGVQGVTGTTGAKGDKGDTGAKGDQGIAGVQGVTGTTGAKGDKGDTGAKGDQGIAGAQGVTGATGATGDQGIAGATGAAGKSAYELAVANGYTGTESQYTSASAADNMGNHTASQNVKMGANFINNTGANNAGISFDSDNKIKLNNEATINNAFNANAGIALGGSKIGYAASTGGSNPGLGFSSSGNAELTGNLSIDGTITLSGGSPGVGKVLVSDASGNATWQTPAGGGSLTNFTESASTTAPNDTINAAQLIANGASANVNFIITPKGTGAILAQLPDGTATGGNKRGLRAVDLQMGRGSATQVASGVTSVAMGANNTASASGSVAMGKSNTASNINSVAMGGTNTASGISSVAMGGINTASASNSVAMGKSNIASGGSSVAMGSTNTASGGNSVAMGAVNTASGSNSVAMGNGNKASGSQSVAMGTRANTNDNAGSFVFNDNNSSSFIGDSLKASAANQFTTRFSGGYRFFAAAGKAADLTATNGVFINSNSGAPQLGIRTETFGTEALSVAGAVKIADGTQGANKVLTSDANGLASWQTPAGGGATVLANTGSNVSFNSANGLVTVGANSYVELATNHSGGTVVVDFTDGTAVGQVLVITYTSEGTAGTTVTIFGSKIKTGSGKVIGLFDSMSFIWNGSFWIPTSYSDN